MQSRNNITEHIKQETYHALNTTSTQHNLLSNTVPVSSSSIKYLSVQLRHHRHHHIHNKNECNVDEIAMMKFYILAQPIFTMFTVQLVSSNISKVEPNQNEYQICHNTPHVKMLFS